MMAGILLVISLICFYIIWIFTPVEWEKGLEYQQEAVMQEQEQEQEQQEKKEREVFSSSFRLQSEGVSPGL